MSPPPAHPAHDSFPTRRSSDLDTPSDFGLNGARPSHPELLDWLAAELVERGWRDRKSTRLNSSHRCISYAVFCLKKKTYNCGKGWRDIVLAMDTSGDLRISLSA